MSQSNFKKTAWIIWVVASFFYAYQYILRVMPNILLDDIMTRFEISATTFGQFSGIYYISYALMHLPIGIMLDRFGPRRVMTSCILLTVVGLAPLLFSTHWIFPLFGRFLIGLGSSAAILGVFKVIRMTFPEKIFGRMLSISVTIGLLGAIYGGGPLSYIRTLLGYEGVVELLAILGCVLAAFTYWIVPNQPAESQGSVLGNVKEVFTNGRVIFSCLFAGLMVGPLEGFADVWGTAFLKQVYGYQGTAAATLPSLIFIGMCFGAPVLSLVAEKLGNPIITIIGSGVVMGFAFISMLAFPLSATLLSVNFVLIGVASAYQILAISKASTFVRGEVAGLTTAVANMIIMLFGYCFHSVIGYTVHYFGGPQSSIALFYGVGVIPVALLIGTFGYVFIFAKEPKLVEVQS